MTTIITSPRASDILELFRPSQFDGHVKLYRQEKWLADSAAANKLRAAALDEATARLIADVRARRSGVTEETRQRLAVSALLGQCEAIAGSGALTEPAEQSLRVLIAHTLNAFQMPSKAEREAV